MRFFRRGPSDEPEPQPDEEPEAPTEAPTDDAPEPQAEPPTEAPAEEPEPGDDLIGDEWRTVASPDDVPMPEPTALELDLAGEPNAILGQLDAAAPVERAGVRRRARGAVGVGRRLQPREGRRGTARAGAGAARAGPGEVAHRVRRPPAQRVRRRRRRRLGRDRGDPDHGRRRGGAVDGRRRARPQAPRPVSRGGGPRGARPRCSRRAMRSTGSRGRRSRAARRSCSSSASTARARPRPSASSPRASARNGRRVVLAAADTFRAAAIDQLRIWAQRTDSEIVAHAPNADPAAVVFDALDAAIARHADILIADTAGRLHTKSNLMEELAKVRRVIDKRLPGADGRDLLRPRRDDRPERPRAGEGVPRGGRPDRRRAHQARLDGQGRHRVRDRARPRRPRPLRRGGGAGRRPAAVRPGRLRRGAVRLRPPARRRAGGRPLGMPDPAVCRDGALGMVFPERRRDRPHGRRIRHGMPGSMPMGTSIGVCQSRGVVCRHPPRARTTTSGPSRMTAHPERYVRREHASRHAQALG